MNRTRTSLGRVVREVDAQLVPFGRYTATERVRIGRVFRDKYLGTQLSSGHDPQYLKEAKGLK
jgi:hypothetical protein